jgi:hypothetical protein
MGHPGEARASVDRRSSALTGLKKVFYDRIPGAYARLSTVAPSGLELGLLAALRATAGSCLGERLTTTSELRLTAACTGARKLRMNLESLSPRTRRSDLIDLLTE